MKLLFQNLKEVLQRGEDAVLVTVVASSGSTPRGAGARMLITKDGRLRGTIGGGAVEYRCEQMAAEVLKAKTSKMQEFILRRNQVEDLGMICGGDVTIYFQYISQDDAVTKTFLEAVEVMYEQGEMCWLVNDMTDDTAGGFAVVGKKSGCFGMDLPEAVMDALGSRPGTLTAGGRTYYFEKLIQAGRVYIFGGGHVAQALVPALSAVDFRCVVCEDREDFCRPVLFPGVEETILLDINNINEVLNITEDDYVCIMTRGHKDDLIVQAQVLKTPANYIGVIGSKKKTAGVFAQLKDMGFTDADLTRITTPIGLNIHGETPAEIAVSITAQLIEHRAMRTKK